MSFRTTLGALLMIVTVWTASVAAGAMPALVDAARGANWNAVRSMIKEGPRDAVNASDTDGTRPLHFAVRADELDVVDLLLRAGADPKVENRLGVTPLLLAAQNGNAAMIRRLLDAGANANQVDRTGETILMVAIRTGDVDSVRTLLKY